MEKIVFYFEPLFLSALFLIIIGCVLFYSYGKAKNAGGVFKFYPLILIPVLLALFVRSADLPVRHVSVFDEYSHLGIAGVLASSGKLCELKKGSCAEPEICQVSHWPGGYHTALAIWLRFPSRDGEAEASAFSFFLVLLTVFGTVLLAYETLRGFFAGLLAAFFLAFSTPYVMYSFSTETGVFSSLLVMSSVLALYVHMRHEGAWSALLLVSTVCTAVLTRYENILLLILVPFVVYANRKNMRIFLKFLPLVIVSVLIYSIHIFYAVRHMEMLNAPLFVEFPYTFAKNIFFWVDPAHSDLPAALLAAAGFYKLVKDKNMIPAVFAVYLPVYSLAVPPFISGPDMVRYVLTLMPMYCVMIVVGFCSLTGFPGLLKSKKYILIPAVFVLLAVYLVQKTAGVKKAWEAVPDQIDRRGRVFLEQSGKQIPSGAYFLTYAPDYITFGTDRKAALPVYEREIAGSLAVLKDRFWYIAASQYPSMEADLKKRFYFQRAAVMDIALPESENNHSLYLLKPLKVTVP